MTEQAPLASPKLAALRLIAQGLLETAAPRTPTEAIQLLACAQGQHLGGVIAALALRSGGDVGAVEQAFADGRIVRGYPMRGTVFALAAEDAKWMTELGGARTVRGAAKRRAELDLSEAKIADAAENIREFLADSERGALARLELAALLAGRGMALSGPQRYHLFFHLIASGELVYGPLNGSEHLVVDARTHLPADSGLEARFNGDEIAATGEWLLRYLRGHGPATLRDFAWWSKLPLGQIRRGAEAAGLSTDAAFECYGIDARGDALWGGAGLRGVLSLHGQDVATARLLPPFDEYYLGYPDRDWLVSKDDQRRIVPGNNGVFKPTIYFDRQVIGTWRSAGTGVKKRLEVDLFAPDNATNSAPTNLSELFTAYPHRG